MPEEPTTETTEIVQRPIPEEIMAKVEPLIAKLKEWYADATIRSRD